MVTEIRRQLAQLDDPAPGARQLPRTAFDVDPPPPRTVRDLLDGHVRGILSNALRPNTRRSYADQWRWYVEWCILHGRDPYTRSTLHDHLTALAIAHPGSVRSRYFAVYRMTGIGDRKLHAHMTRLRRGYAPAPRAGIPIELLEMLIARVERLASPKRERDAVVLLVSYFGALRRSEFVALDWSDVAIDETRLRLRIRRSKASLRPETVYLPARSDRLCPRAAVLRWATFGTDGPFIRAVHRRGGVQLHRGAPVPRIVSLILKEHLEAVGIDPASFASHGLRVGGLTTMHIGGATDTEVRRHARHASERTLMRYIRADGSEDFSEALGL